MRLGKALVLAIALQISVGCSVPIVKPGWQDGAGNSIGEVSVTERPGGRVETPVKFVPADNESNGLGVRVGGDQASWMTVEPERLTSVIPGVAVPLLIRVAIPPGTPRGTYSASVVLLTGAKAVSRLGITIVVRPDGDPRAEAPRVPRAG